LLGEDQNIYGHAFATATAAAVSAVGNAITGGGADTSRHFWPDLEESSEAVKQVETKVETHGMKRGVNYATKRRAKRLKKPQTRSNRTLRHQLN